MAKSKWQAAQNNIIGNRAGLMLMSLVLLLTFAFGTNGLNMYPIRTDELFSVANIGGFNPPYSPMQIIDSIIKYSPNHVPLFYLLGAVWAQLAGWSQYALRLFSVLAGMLMVAWFYRLGTDMFNRRIGLLAAILMITSAYMILYVHDFRMYTLLLLLAIMHTWLYWRLAYGYCITRLPFCLFVATAIAFVYTHLFSLVWFAGLGLYHLVFVSKSRRWLQIALGWGISALFFLPYFPVLISAIQFTSENLNITAGVAPPEVLIQAFFHLLGNGIEILPVLFAGMLAFAFWHKRDAIAIKLMLTTLAILTLLILLNELMDLIPMTGTDLATPVRMRYFLILWIPCMLLFAYGLSLMPCWPWVAILCLLLWSMAGYQFYRSGIIRSYAGGMNLVSSYPPMQNYIYHLEGKVRPQDYLLGFTLLDSVNSDLKHGKSVADFYTQLHLGIDGAFIWSRAFGDWQAREVRDKIDRHPYLLFTYAPQDKSKHFDTALALIESDYAACDVIVDTPDLFVQRYVNSILDCHREYAPIAYDNGIKVVDRFARYVPEADLVRILTGWEVADERLLYEYNVSLQIITPDWQNTGRQIDRHLHEEDVLKWYAAELSTDGLPPGDYRVMVIVYDRETNKKVSGTDLTNGQSTDIFPILTFAIPMDS